MGACVETVSIPAQHINDSAVSVLSVVLTTVYITNPAYPIAGTTRYGVSSARMNRQALDIESCLEGWGVSLQGARQSERERYYKIRCVQKFSDELGWSSVEDITKAEVMRARDSMDGLASKTVNLNLSRLRTFLQWCVDTGRLSENPAEGVKPPRVIKGDGQRALTTIELDALIAVSPHPRKALYQFAAFTGLRWGECRKLRWRHVVLDDPAHLNLDGNLTKNSKPAVLPLAWKALEALGSVHTDAAQPDDPVFLMPDPRTIVNDLKRARIDVQDAAGRRASFHSLRKFFATQLANGGVDVYVAKELMRHASVTTTERSYIDAKQLEMRKKLDRVFPKPEHGEKSAKTNKARLTDPCGKADDAPAPEGRARPTPAGADELNDPGGIRTRTGLPLTDADPPVPPGAVADAVALLAAFIGEYLRRYDNEDCKTR